MKDFNLEEAKAGKPVVLVSSKNESSQREVRLLCFDRRRNNNNNTIVGLVAFEDGYENIYTFTKDGVCFEFDDCYLVMKPEKKTLWANLYKSPEDEYQLGDNVLYDSETRAKDNARRDCFKTIKIEFEI